jgi:trans-AT polyketide synthase/acyltransferase/oxidoreductase domain-containing protein
MPAGPPAITAESLGSTQFKAAYGLRCAYVAGSMYKGISSSDMVIALGKAGLIGYLGTGGLDPARMESAIRRIQSELADGQPYGVNLLCNLARPRAEQQAVDMFLRAGIRHVEAAAFVRITPSLAYWRLKGIRRGPDGRVIRPRRVLAKVSRPEVAAAFLRPAPDSLLNDLVAAGRLTPVEAELGELIPMADEICVEADSGGHTDQGVAYALMPAMLALRDRIQAEYRYDRPVHVGAAGGIGTPHAAAAAFILGADFVLTGSINQCTVEAGTSDAVKDLLQALDVQDTAYAPAGDMFEIGARVQVARRGLFFPARANRLYELYQRLDSIDELDPKVKRQIEEQYLHRSFDEALEETRAHYWRSDPEAPARGEFSPKEKLAMVFRSYFVHATRLAMQGVEDRKVDFQVHCGPAMGAFNQWVGGTALEPWRNRHVADIAEMIMNGAAQLLNDRFDAMSGGLQAMPVASS